MRVVLGQEHALNMHRVTSKRIGPALDRTNKSAWDHPREHVVVILGQV